MLIKYKKSAKKITMGLLSFMPNVRELTALEQTMQKYEENADWQLYLWKQGEDFIGLIGIEAQELTFTVHHVTVNPSFRNEAIGHEMVEKLQQLQGPRAMRSTQETKDFLAKCWQTKHSS
ncbi:riboflavin biosynthesis protein ribT, acetyltransferase GNAT-family [Planococcus antarcticus DSM 14505]|uniref:Riboflavin biosynthesis protein ribT, acetyltransferase GNAT-family n=1 Tax=Planococcus antarcticus DSM 14505 TaxID=1185653 RepID=A0AA87IHP6_9BACL|nr:GNAT family N-acetyltransferase [Planococcus antarcticus]EIM05086.1 riboflavin biosynthesis protein ribT, acetyltransferase GNAT-family [Planococcus antarcticus DSM 14505]